MRSAFERTPYEEAITRPCSRCRAGEGDYCRNPLTGEASRLPCIVRLAVVNALVWASVALGVVAEWLR